MKDKLPKYSLRISKRAQRPRVRIRPDIGLELVLPKGYSQESIPEILEHFRPWIKKHYQRIMSSNATTWKLDKKEDFPKGFFISGGQAYVQVLEAGSSAYHASADFLEEEAQKQGIICPREVRLEEIFLPRGASLDDLTSSYHWLREWVREYARHKLTREIKALALKHGFELSKLSFRFQKTRWGSCSSKGNISLNSYLIFLPDELAKYILVHELCHLKSMDHSQAFWKEVFKIDRRAMEWEKLMRGASKYIPGWLLALN